MYQKRDRKVINIQFISITREDEFSLVNNKCKHIYNLLAACPH